MNDSFVSESLTVTFNMIMALFEKITEPFDGSSEALGSISEVFRNI